MRLPVLFSVAAPLLSCSPARAWLTDADRFCKHRLEDNLIPQDDASYKRDNSRPIRYVYKIKRDELFEDLFHTLA